MYLGRVGSIKNIPHPSTLSCKNVEVNSLGKEGRGKSCESESPARSAARSAEGRAAREAGRRAGLEAQEERKKEIGTNCDAIEIPKSLKTLSLCIGSRKALDSPFSDIDAIASNKTRAILRISELKMSGNWFCRSREQECRIYRFRKSILFWGKNKSEHQQKRNLLRLPTWPLC